MATEFVVKTTHHIRTEEDIDLETILKEFENELDLDLSSSHETQSGIGFVIEDGNVEVIDKIATVEEIMSKAEGKDILLEDPKRILQKKTQLDEFLLNWLDGRILEKYGVEFGDSTWFENNQVVILIKHRRVGVPIKVGFSLPLSVHAAFEKVMEIIKKTPELGTGKKSNVGQNLGG